MSASLPTGIRTRARGREPVSCRCYDFRMKRIALGIVLAVGVGCGGGDLYEGMPEHVERRHVPLDGAANFRDLGGYESEDGRSVKWGRLYRADALGDLSDSDLETLSGLGIKLVCDFRSAPEVEEAPDRLPPVNPPEVLALPIFDEDSFGDELRERISSGDLEGFDVENLLVDANRRFVTHFADRYEQMFERITRPQSLPALIHCTGGKDRAGFGSAIILRTLGVPLDTVIEDYMLTNHYTAAKMDRMMLLIRVSSLFRTDPEKLRPIFGVERRYIEAAFDQIEETHGSFDEFRRNALGLSDEETARFRERMLE